MSQGKYTTDVCPKPSFFLLIVKILFIISLPIFQICCLFKFILLKQWLLKDNFEHWYFEQNRFKNAIKLEKLHLIRTAHF